MAGAAPYLPIMQTATVKLVRDPDRGWIWDVMIAGKNVAFGDAMFFGRAKRRAVEAAARELAGAGEIEVVKHTYLRRPRVVARVQARTIN